MIRKFSASGLKVASDDFNLTQSAPDMGNNIPMLFEMPTAVSK
jgi:hypothetical protein